MVKRFLIAAMLSVGMTGAANAAGGDVPLLHASVDISNTASLQRGARTFINYCSGCHSAQYMRYSRLMEDLGLTEEQMRASFMFNPDSGFGDLLTVAMDPEDAEQWFGVVPPDLTLVARSKGVDWVYTFLKSYYADPGQGTGWNNTLFKGTAMPHVLWELQGVQELNSHEGEVADEAEAEGHAAAQNPFTMRAEGKLSAAEYDAMLNDLVTFLEYMGEPAKLERKSVGVWVLLYLSLFAFVAFLLKREFWRDVH